MRTLLITALLTFIALPAAAEKLVLENNPDDQNQTHAQNPPQDFDADLNTLAQVKPCDLIQQPGRTSGHSQRSGGQSSLGKPGCDKPIGRFPQQTKPDRG